VRIFGFIFEKGFGSGSGMFQHDLHAEAGLIAVEEVDPALGGADRLDAEAGAPDD
jgi:hypothetical protein